MQDRKIITIIFFLLVIVELFAEWQTENIPILRYIIKPLPLLWLMYNLKPMFSIKYGKLALLGLTFSLIGDIILLFQDVKPIFFIGGLLSFLTAHILYIFSFNSIVNDKLRLLLKSPVKTLFALLYITYAGIVSYILFPHLGEMAIPVLIYVLVILTMLLKAYSLNTVLPKTYFIFIGASFFVTSDTILAFNKFYNPLVHSGIWIMSTYYFAQYFISMGILKLNNSTK